jgi:hypothetical protein
MDKGQPVKTLTTRFLSTVALALCLAGGAKALPITDIYAPEGGLSLSSGSPVNFTHNLIPYGFDPAEDLLTSALLTLAITGGGGGQSLLVEINDDELFSGSLNTLGGLLVSVAYLQNTGMIDVSLSKGGGTTWTFNSSTLRVDGTSQPISDPGNGSGDPVPVPEPGTLMIFALGLLGLAAFFRRRQGRMTASFNEISHA